MKINCKRLVKNHNVNNIMIKIIKVIRTVLIMKCKSQTKEMNKIQEEEKSKQNVKILKILQDMHKTSQFR